MRPLTARTPWLAALILLLSACGWHLRGAVQLPTGLESIAINTRNSGQELAQMLRQTLAGAGIDASMDGSPAGAWQLDILGEQLQRREISISREVRTAEYGLVLVVEWQLRNPAGEIVIAPSTNKAQSTYRHDTDNLAGKRREEDRLVSDMRRYVSGQILRRIEHSQRSTTAPTP